MERIDIQDVLERLAKLEAQVAELQRAERERVEAANQMAEVFQTLPTAVM